MTSLPGRRAARTLLAGACVAALAGCGGPGAQRAGTTSAPARAGGALYADTGSGRAPAAFARCMRVHGVVLGARGAARVSPTSPKFRRAAAACRTSSRG